jgi:hypothetical protein
MWKANEAAAVGARGGMLLGSQATPACVILTRNGAVPFTTPSQLNQILSAVTAAGVGSLSPQLLHVCALDLIGKPGARGLAEYASGSSKPQGRHDDAATGPGNADAESAGLATFCGLSPHRVFLSTHNVAAWAYGTGTGASDLATNASTNQGHVKLTPNEYIDFVRAARPAVFDALSDPLPANQLSKNRVRKSVDRTVAWLDAQIKLEGSGGGPPAQATEGRR